MYPVLEVDSFPITPRTISPVEVLSIEKHELSVRRILGAVDAERLWRRSTLRIIISQGDQMEGK